MLQFPQIGSPNGFVKRAGAAIPEVPTDGFLRSLMFEPVHSGMGLLQLRYLFVWLHDCPFVHHSVVALTDA